MSAAGPSIRRLKALFFESFWNAQINFFNVTKSKPICKDNSDVGVKSPRLQKTKNYFCAAFLNKKTHRFCLYAQQRGESLNKLQQTYSVSNCSENPWLSEVTALANLAWQRYTKGRTYGRGEKKQQSIKPTAPVQCGGRLRSQKPGCGQKCLRCVPSTYYYIGSTVSRSSSSKASAMLQKL